jgi:hypothetical protein
LPGARRTAGLIHHQMSSLFLAQSEGKRVLVLDFGI